eukprot:13304229-Alexandrium_andersonii.AAC.2
MLTADPAGSAQPQFEQDYLATTRVDLAGGLSLIALKPGAAAGPVLQTSFPAVCRRPFYSYV